MTGRHLESVVDNPGIQVRGITGRKLNFEVYILHF